jgi:hypothetical protein
MEAETPSETPVKSMVSEYSKKIFGKSKNVMRIFAPTNKQTKSELQSKKHDVLYAPPKGGLIHIVQI